MAAKDRNCRGFHQESYVLSGPLAQGQFEVAFRKNDDFERGKTCPKSNEGEG